MKTANRMKRVGAVNHQVIAGREISQVGRRLLAFTLFWIWKERCARIFRNTEQNVGILANSIVSEWLQYRKNTEHAKGIG